MRPGVVHLLGPAYPILFRSPKRSPRPGCAGRCIRLGCGAVVAAGRDHVVWVDHLFEAVDEAPGCGVGAELVGPVCVVDVQAAGGEAGCGEQLIQPVQCLVGALGLGLFPVELDRDYSEGTVFADPGWARALGIICLFACALSTFGLATAEPDHKTSERQAVLRQDAELR
jgi:hypothetical protein